MKTDIKKIFDAEIQQRTTYKIDGPVPEGWKPAVHDRGTTIYTHPDPDITDLIIAKNGDGVYRSTAGTIFEQEHLFPTLGREVQDK